VCYNAGMFHSLYNHTPGSLAPGLGFADKPGSLDKTDKTFLNWPANFLDGFQDFDPNHWQLEINGLVERPQAFNLKDMNSFTRIQQNRRLVFADGWTYRAPWEGFVLQELLHRVAPKPEAKFLIQTNLLGHQECLPLKDLYAQRTLLCMRVSGKQLPPLYGGPLRLMVFDRYAHKGLGQITKLELSEVEIPGYFATKGYDPLAQIEPGFYYSPDLKVVQHIKTPGEVTQW
jgi:DMSO/TMAO reductase YedYZ molybdopterin-dependent catalytic subunit